MIDPDKLRNFEEAFSTGSHGCVGTCRCGKTYFDAHNSSCDWEKGELERLEKIANPVDFAVGGVHFEGCDYLDACTCWHERAKRIMDFIEVHASSIARYLNLEKARKQREADKAPGVEVADP
jgi:hypothetical protein